MKTNLLGSFIVGSLIFVGCSKQEDTAAPAITPAPSATIETSQKSANDAVAAVRNEATEASTAVETAAKTAVETAAKNAANAVKAPEVPTPGVPATPAAQTSVEAVFDQVKGLIGQKRYPEALGALAQLSNANLSAEQQRLVEQLKAQVQSAMASQTANDGLKSVGGLLKGNK